MPSLGIWILGIFLAFIAIGIRTNRKSDSSTMGEGIQISVGLMMWIGIIYALSGLNSPHPKLVAWAMPLMFLAAISVPIVGLSMIPKIGCIAGYFGGLFAGLILIAVSFLCATAEVATALMPAIVVILFMAVGFVNALFGPVLTGFSLAFTVDSFLKSGTVHQIYLWKDLFEFFDISSPALKVAVLFGSTASTAYELIVALKNN